MILIDSDVLLDDALDRAALLQIDSSDFLKRAWNKQVGMVFVSWHSIANLYYIASRERADEDVRRIYCAPAQFRTNC